jgi:alkyldihydroxyacetonephosphate synthase
MAAQSPIITRSGCDHRPWYDRQRPPLFGEALRAAGKALDPQGLLNPGVLIDP